MQHGQFNNCNGSRTKCPIVEFEIGYVHQPSTTSLHRILWVLRPTVEGLVVLGPCLVDYWTRVHLVIQHARARRLHKGQTPLPTTNSSSAICRRRRYYHCQHFAKYTPQISSLLAESPGWFTFQSILNEQSSLTLPDRYQLHISEKKLELLYNH